MNWGTLLVISVLMFVISFASLSSVAHALTFQDIIDQIISIFTGQTQSSSTQGCLGGDCSRILPGSVSSSSTASISPTTSTTSTTTTTITTTTNSITATTTTVSTLTTTTTTTNVCPGVTCTQACATCPNEYQGGGCWYLNTSDCTCVPPGGCFPIISASTSAATTISNPSYTINFAAGWNLFSVPVKSVVSSSTDCSPASPVFSQLNGAYYDTAYTNGGIGYWVKMNSDCQANVTGTNITTNDFSHLSQGWNLIGAPASSVSISDVLGTCVILSGPLYYDTSTGNANVNGNYVYSSTLDPGRGYFIEVSDSCKLGL